MRAWHGWLAVWLACVTLGIAGGTTLEYDVFYKDKLVGSQTIAITRADGMNKIAALTGLDIKVLFVRYKFNEDFKAEFKDGQLQNSECRTVDDGKPLNVTVTAADGKWRILREDARERRESFVDVDKVDLYSASMYLEPDKVLAMTASGAASVRVFQLDEGVVSEQKIERAGTARQMLADTEYHVQIINWRRGKYTNQSRHAPELGNLPLHCIYEDENGKTVFVLKKCSQ